MIDGQTFKLTNFHIYNINRITVIVSFFFWFTGLYGPITATTLCLHLSLSFAHCSAFVTFSSFKYPCILFTRVCLGRLLGLLVLGFHLVTIISKFNYSFRPPYMPCPAKRRTFKGPNNSDFFIKIIQFFVVSTSVNSITIFNY